MEAAGAVRNGEVLPLVECCSLEGTARWRRGSNGGWEVLRLDRAAQWKFGAPRHLSFLRVKAKLWLLPASSRSHLV